MAQPKNNEGQPKSVWSKVWKSSNDSYTLREVEGITPVEKTATRYVDMAVGFNVTAHRFFRTK